MSGPVEETTRPSNEGFGLSTIEVKKGRRTQLGDMGILRVLPTSGRRSIGPWCFVDLMSPETVDQPPPLEVGPHPHIGLSTVTWLFAGIVLHTDSLGNEQPIRPGELNLMTSGRGIAHAEEGIGPARFVVTPHPYRFQLIGVPMSSIGRIVHPAPNRYPRFEGEHPAPGRR